MMSSGTIIYILIGLGALIIAGLAFYAGRLLFFVQQQKQKQQQAVQQHNDEVVKSLKVIAAATFQGQCELSEASIRLSVLMGRLQLENELRETMEASYKGVLGLYESIKHLDTHESRNALSKKDRREQDLFRMKQEMEFESAIQNELPLFEQFDWHLKR